MEERKEGYQCEEEHSITNASDHVDSDFGQQHIAMHMSRVR